MRQRAERARDGGGLLHQVEQVELRAERLARRRDAGTVLLEMLERLHELAIPDWRFS